MSTDNFNGAKLAVLVSDQILVLKRDDTPGLSWAGKWDLPGGGREGAESPLDCALRETFEEAGVVVHPSTVVHEAAHDSNRAGRPNWFFVAKPGWLALPPLRLGREGSDVRWMTVQTYLDLPDAVPHLQDRVAGFLGLRSVQAAPLTFVTSR